MKILYYGLAGSKRGWEININQYHDKTIYSQLRDCNWTPNVEYGDLDQHTLLTPSKTMCDCLKDAFLPLYEQENELNQVIAKWLTQHGGLGLDVIDLNRDVAALKVTVGIHKKFYMIHRILAGEIFFIKRKNRYIHVSSIDKMNDY